MKKAFYILLSLFSVYLVLCFFGPSEIKVERTVRIQKPLSFVKERLGNFKYFHDKWSPWTEKDPAMITTFKGIPNETGHFYSWSGNEEVGKGEMEIVAIKPDSICERLSFDGQGDSKAYFIVKEDSSLTKVTWGMVFQVSFLKRPIMLFVNMDKMLGKDYEKGLSNLKATLESENESGKTFSIQELEWEETNFLGRKESVGFDEMEKYFETHFGLLDMVLEKANIKPASAPCGLFFSYDGVNQKADLSCAYKVTGNTKLEGWETFTFPACRVLCIEYKGDPSNSGEAHKAMDDYIKSHNLEYTMVIEEYLSDPNVVSDKSEWVTKIYYLLK